MNRNEFISKMAILSSGFIFAKCTDLVEIPEDTLMKSLDIEDAKKWFSEVYLSHYKNLRTSGESYQRRANWNLAKLLKDNNKKELIFVPIEYENENLPCILNWTEETKYRQELPEYFIRPLHEGLVIYNEQNSKKAFLLQLAFDPYETVSNHNVIKESSFTGWAVKADWDDTIVDLIVYEKGRIFGSYSKEKKKNARTNLVCYDQQYTYQTWTVVDGVFTIIQHTAYQTICIDQGGTGTGYYYPGYGEGVYIENGVTSYYSQQMQSTSQAKIIIPNDSTGQYWRERLLKT